MTLPVKEFSTTEEMYASAKAVHLRMFPPRRNFVSYTTVRPTASKAAPPPPPPPATVEASQYVKPIYRIPSIAHLTPKQLTLLAKRVAEHRKKRGTSTFMANKVEGFEELGLVKIADLVRLVETITGIRKIEIHSQQRLAQSVKARQIVMWLAIRFTLRSSPDIGRMIGGRDHTTVLHAVAKLNAIIAKIGRPTEDSPEAWTRHLWQADWRDGNRKKHTVAPAPLNCWTVGYSPALSQKSAA